MQREGDRKPGKRLVSGKADQTPKQPKEKKPSRLTRHQKLLIALAVVLALGVAGVAAWQSLFVRPDVTAEKEPLVITDPETGETEEVEEIDWGEGTRPRSDGERKSKDYYTVLILGRDVPWDIKRINSVYNYYGGGDRGIQYLYKEISQLVGFEPDFQVVVEWEAVGEIVDAMGGVWFDVPRNMDYEDPLQNLSIHISKGYQLLNGQQAMGVVRFRKGANGYATGDLGRIETQQAFLKAVVEQLLKVENVAKIKDFIRVFQENVITDLSFQNIFWFAKAAIVGGLKVENVNFVTMPNTPKNAYSPSTSKLNGHYSEQAYVVPRATQLLELVNTELSPYVEVFTKSDLDIMSVNSDGSVSSSTGHVEDGNATYPRSYWQAQWTQEEEEPEPVTDEFGNILDPETGEIIGNVNDGTGGTTTDPGTGGAVTDPGGTGSGSGTSDWPLDPETGEPLPPEMVSPGGTNTGTETETGTNGGTQTDPGTGTVPDSGTEGGASSGAETDPGTTDSGFGDGGFTIIGPPPAA